MRLDMGSGCGWLAEVYGGEVVDAWLGGSGYCFAFEIRRRECSDVPAVSEMKYRLSAINH